VGEAIALVVTEAGSLVAAWLHRESGPVIVIIAALVFVLSLVLRR